jgi:hypothetical protein
MTGVHLYQINITALFGFEVIYDILWHDLVNIFK